MRIVEGQWLWILITYSQPANIISLQRFRLCENCAAHYGFIHNVSSVPSSSAAFDGLLLNTLPLFKYIHASPSVALAVCSTHLPNCNHIEYMYALCGGLCCAGLGCCCCRYSFTQFRIVRNAILFIRDALLKKIILKRCFWCVTVLSVSRSRPSFSLRRYVDFSVLFSSAWLSPTIPILFRSYLCACTA